jgi:hypothetical protein
MEDTIKILTDKIEKFENTFKEINYKFIYQNEINEKNKEIIEKLRENILFDKIILSIKEFFEVNRKNNFDETYKLLFNKKYKILEYSTSFNKYFVVDNNERTTKNKVFILYKILKYEINNSLKKKIEENKLSGFVDKFVSFLQFFEINEVDYENYIFDKNVSDIEDINTFWSIIDLNKYYENYLVNDISFYCVNFNDEDRRNKMTNRFNYFNFDLQFVEPVYSSDSRIKNIPTMYDKRTWSIMLQHLDSIKHFLEYSDKPYLIVCEDDILISKKFKNDLPDFILNMKEMKLNILLLGYLMDFKFERNMTNYPKIKDCSYCYYNDFPVLKNTDKYLYMDYHYSLWGCQMYLITREQAIFLTKKYTIEYGINNPNSHFNPDWTISKDGKKSLVHPVIALEEGNSKLGQLNQSNFHERCFLCHYQENMFV